MMRSHRWMSVICCCVLFIVVFLAVRWNMRGAFRAAGHPELGLLVFLIPGAVASFFARQERVVEPLIGVMIALPACVIALHTIFASERSFWQELAWLFSAVFWSSLGSLCFLLVFAMRRKRRGFDRRSSEK
ncbi:inner membrane protein YbjM [Shimwellia blattae]|nr:inner membrane protein YbjM [Shimwellia blattae]